MKGIINKISVLFIVGLLLGALCAPVCADDVTDSISQGLAQYEKGQFTEAAASLDYASQLIRQKKGGSLQSILPKPLKGWEADEASSQAFGAAMFGGGVTAERVYRKEDATVTVRIVTDSPALQAMMMMLSNPAFAASAGMQSQIVGGQRAIVEYDPAEKSGDLNIVVAGRFMVTVEGDSATLDEIKAYAAAIDFDRLAASK